MEQGTLIEHADQVLALEAEVRALREALRWAFVEWGESADWVFDEVTDMPDATPEHECRYDVAPDEGYCLFCDEFWKAYLLVFTPSLAPEPPEATDSTPPASG